ncbi:MAG TPA: ATP-binding cassette domain-containing protein [Fimbriimonadaceae bacterium]|jgi:phospholipid/cholesterol/gamma-HCH transport system ATP-binding protein
MVVVKDLVKAFGDHQVLKGISLEIDEGEILAIMGSSGGGKTTLLRCMSGLINFDSGQVEIDGIDVKKNAEAARNKMGMVFQSAALFDFLSVEDNVLFGIKRRLKLKPEEQRELSANTLNLVGLKGFEKLKPAELSGGMKKRVGIARALALKPNLMLYDEPTTGLDPITSYTVDALIVEVRNQMKMTSVVVSHDVSSVFRVADKIAFLHEGQLIFFGNPDDFEKSKEQAIRELLEKASATKLDLSEATF